MRDAQLALARERALLQEQELRAHARGAELAHRPGPQLCLEPDELQPPGRRAAAGGHSPGRVRSGHGHVRPAARCPAAAGDAEISYFRALVNYNIAILQVHFRKGSLLEYNGVYLAEGPWPAKAYFDARRRARERDAGLYLDYGFTRPGVFSRGAFPQEFGDTSSATSPAGADKAPTEAVSPPDGEPADGSKPDSRATDDEADTTDSPPLPADGEGTDGTDEPAEREEEPMDTTSPGPTDESSATPLFNAPTRFRCPPRQAAVGPCSDPAGNAPTPLGQTSRRPIRDWQSK